MPDTKPKKRAYKDLTEEEQETMILLYDKHNGNLTAMAKDKLCKYKSRPTLVHYKQKYNWPNKLEQLRTGYLREFLDNRHKETEVLWEIWRGGFNEAEIKAIIKSGRYGGLHSFIAKVLAGDMKALKTLLDKLFANQNLLELKMPEQEKIEEAIEKINLLTNARDNKNPIPSKGQTPSNPASV